MVPTMCTKEGCTDPDMTDNYDARYTKGDTSCRLTGCQKNDADNYVAKANVYGKCEYRRCNKVGMDNYDARWTIEGVCHKKGCKT